MSADKKGHGLNRAIAKPLKHRGTEDAEDVGEKSKTRGLERMSANRVSSDILRP